MTLCLIMTDFISLHQKPTSKMEVILEFLRCCTKRIVVFNFNVYCINKTTLVPTPLLTLGIRMILFEQKT